MALKKQQSQPLLQWNRGDANVIPARFLALLNGKSIVQNGVPLDVTPDALSLTTVASSLKQTRTDEREKTTVSIDNPVGKTYVDYKFDPESGKVIPVTQEIVATPTGGDIPTGLDTDGTYSEFQGLTPEIGLLTTQRATGLTTRSYVVTEHIALPRVLSFLTFVAFYDKAFPVRNPFNLLDPDDEAYQSTKWIHYPANIVQVGVAFELTDYSGDYPVLVEESWQKEPFTGLAAFNPQPRGISWATPFNSGSIPPCLHGAVSIVYSTGTNHPRYALAEGSFDYDATNYTDVVGDRVIQDVQMPYQGGYRRIKKTATIS